MPKLRNPLHSEAASGKMDEDAFGSKSSLQRFLGVHFVLIGTILLTILQVATVHTGPINESDSARAVTLYNEGWRWMNLGWSDEKTRAWHLDSAKYSFRKALHLSPDYPEPHNGLGWAYYYSDSTSLATREFEIAKVMKPSHRGPYMGLGLIDKDAKRWKEAERELRMAVAVWPYHYLSLVKGNQPLAMDYTRRDSDYRKTVKSLAEVLASQGQEKESRIWSDSVINMEKRDRFGLREGVPLPPRTGRVTIKVLGFARDSLLFYTLPLMVDTAKIEYPPIGLQAGIEATVKLLLSVNKKGEVVKTQVSRSSGNEALDEAAKGITKAKFSPPRLKRKLSKGALPICDLFVEVAFKLVK